ncbi:hypothetical protein [Streptomyces sp. NBC_00859]|uniref:hypothetical protein n=1 Tax=Streptomyces sp. NBC_00859 TaxID=2903682 RepID=UPI00386FB186|nr:hypothetical protein OG584_25795 [Streptomyces sp. NBC_00859]
MSGFALIIKRSLALKIVGVVAVFFLLLLLLGGMVGAPELGIWTVLLIAAITLVICRHRRRVVGEGAVARRTISS